MKQLKAKNSEVAKNQAVSTTLGLIFSAFLIALIVTFGLPKLLALFLGNDTAESIKTFVNIITGLITSSLFLWLSWDRINATVGSAIDAAVNERIETEVSRYKQELDNYRKMESLEAVIKRQNREFYAAIPDNSRCGKEDLLSLNIYSDESLTKAFRRRVARDAIIRGLAYNDSLLVDIALSASKRVLNKVKLSPVEASQDTDLQLFRQDIYVYLKVWLIFSITNEREMSVSEIKQRCLNSHKNYVSALLDIRERLIRHPEVIQCLEPEYREDAIQLIEEYLDKLVALLQKSVEMKTLPDSLR